MNLHRFCENSICNDKPIVASRRSIGRCRWNLTRLVQTISRASIIFNNPLYFHNHRFTITEIPEHCSPNDCAPFLKRQTRSMREKLGILSLLVLRLSMYVPIYVCVCMYVYLCVRARARLSVRYRRLLSNSLVLLSSKFTPLSVTFVSLPFFSRSI